MAIVLLFGPGRNIGLYLLESHFWSFRMSLSHFSSKYRATIGYVDRRTAFLLRTLFVYACSSLVGCFPPFFASLVSLVWFTCKRSSNELDNNDLLSLCFWYQLISFLSFHLCLTALSLFIR